MFKTQWYTQNTAHQLALPASGRKQFAQDCNNLMCISPRAARIHLIQCVAALTPNDLPTFQLVDSVGLVEDFGILFIILQQKSLVASLSVFQFFAQLLFLIGILSNGVLKILLTLCKLLIHPCQFTIFLFEPGHKLLIHPRQFTIFLFEPGQFSLQLSASFHAAAGFIQQQFTMVCRGHRFYPQAFPEPFSVFGIFLPIALIFFGQLTVPVIFMLEEFIQFLIQLFQTMQLEFGCSQTV